MSIPTWARKGAKVVCVNAEATSAFGVQELIEGDVYVIRWVGWFHHELQGRHAAVRVVGIERFCNRRDYPFDALRFRPLISQADDISTHFQALLSTPVKKEEDA